MLDETHKVFITRFDRRIRVGGMAEITGFNTDLPGKRRLTPDGTPLVGSPALRNLYLNTSHGTVGWTMAGGSGRLLADIISALVPEIRYADLSVACLCAWVLCRRSFAAGLRPPPTAIL